MAWCLKNEHVSTVLLGATKPEQLEENIGSLPVVAKLTAAHMDAIEDILGTQPVAYQGYGGRGMRELITL